MPNNAKTAVGIGSVFAGTLGPEWEWGPTKDPRRDRSSPTGQLKSTAQAHHTTAQMLLSQKGRKWKLMIRRRAGMVKPGLFKS